MYTCTHTQRSAQITPLFITISFFKDFIYLFLEKGDEREKEWGTSMCGWPSCNLHWGTGLKPRHVP